LRRSAAQVGDRILVTGTLGASAAGLRLLETGVSSSTPCAQRAILAHRRPIPRVGEALFLLRHGVRAGADNSDGLLKQVALFCESSHVGAIIDSRLLPIDPCLQSLYPRDHIDLALTGGESYELVVTAPETVLSHVRDLWDQEFATTLIEIGSIVNHDRGLKVIDFHGNVLDAGHWQQGFDHFGIVSTLSR
jgi:thiamine-monophosphate kinase